MQEERAAEALIEAEEYSLKLEERVGLNGWKTWESKEKLIDLLVKVDRVKEAVRVALEFSVKMEEKVGLDNWITWDSK